jgi:hypothetical protein
MDLKKIPDMYREMSVRKQAQTLLDDPEYIQKTDGLLYMYQCVFYLNPQKYGNNFPKLILQKALLKGKELCLNAKPFDLLQDGSDNVEVKFTAGTKLVSQAHVDGGVPIADRYLLGRLVAGADVDSSELIVFSLNTRQMMTFLDKFGKPSHSNTVQSQFNIDGEDAVEYAMANYRSKSWERILKAKTDDARA